MENIPNHSNSVLIILALLGLLALMAVGCAIMYNTKEKGQLFITRYRFTAHQFSRVQSEYPHLTDAHLAMVAHGLKTFFLAHLHEPNVVFAMPSKVVDMLWHVFILDTQAYQTFCQNAFGRYFHHIPDTRMGEANTAANETASERMWRFACTAQGLSPVSLASMPTLFELDKILNIADGFQHDFAVLVSLSQTYDKKYSAGGGGSGGSDSRGSEGNGSQAQNQQYICPGVSSTVCGDAGGDAGGGAASACGGAGCGGGGS